MTGLSNDTWFENSPDIPDYIRKILGDPYLLWFTHQERDRAWRIAMTRKWSSYLIGNADRFFAFGQLQRIASGKQPVSKEDQEAWAKKESLLIQSSPPSRIADNDIHIYTTLDGVQNT